MSVRPGVREEQSHLSPADVELRTGGIRQRGNSKKAANVEAGKRGARQDPTERAAQTRGHVGKGAAGIAAPVHGIPLGAGVARTSPDQAVAVDITRRVKDRLLIEQWIEVVQPLGGRAVERHGIVRQVFGEVGLHHGDRPARPGHGPADETYRSPRS